MTNTSKATGNKSTTYSPKTEEEKAEAYRLWHEFLSELAKQQAFRELVVRHAAQYAEDNRRSSGQGEKGPDKGKNRKE